MPVACFKWERNVLKFNEDFIKKCDENIDQGYIIEVGICYPEELNDSWSS